MLYLWLIIVGNVQGAIPDWPPAASLAWELLPKTAQDFRQQHPPMFNIEALEKMSAWVRAIAPAIQAHDRSDVLGRWFEQYNGTVGRHGHN